jgi:LPXTG-motif cell wall-anchored protein
MKKLIVIGVLTLAAGFAALGVAPSASAYPETSCNVTVSAQKVDSGSALKVHAESQTVTTDDGHGRVAATTVHWRAEFDGTVKQANADVFNTTFDVPKVTEKTVLVLTVNAVMPDATTTCEKSLNITVLPGGTTVSPPGSHLPNTGGPRMILLIGGLLLVGAGAVTVRQSRRRHEGARAAHAA